MGNKLRHYELGADNVYYEIEKKDKNIFQSKFKSLFTVPAWIAVNVINFIVPYGVYTGAFFGEYSSLVETLIRWGIIIVLNIVFLIVLANTYGKRKKIIGLAEIMGLTEEEMKVRYNELAEIVKNSKKNKKSEIDGKKK